MTISHAKESKVESYICKAGNNAGSAENNIEIEIKGGDVIEVEMITDKPIEAPTKAPAYVTTEALTEATTNSLEEAPIEASKEQSEEASKEPLEKQPEEASEGTPTIAPADETAIVSSGIDTFESIADKTEASKCSTITFQNYLILLCAIAIVGF